MEKYLLEFIKYHKIDIDDLYDAKGQTIYQIRDIMKSQDKLFAYNTTPCDKGGHTIRDRHGHCIACSTKNIAFIKRTRKTGYIYIAGSITKQFIKVGFTEEKIESRLGKLNSKKVGNTNDWVVIKAIKCDNVNLVELKIHGLLEKYKVDGDFYEDHESKEIFRCSYDKANEITEQFFDENNILKKEIRTFLTNTNNYKFRNLVNPKFIRK